MMELPQQFRSGTSDLAGLRAQPSGAEGQHHDPPPGPPPNILRFPTAVAQIPPLSDVVIHFDSPSATADRFRLLQMRLEEIQTARGIKRLLITSPLPDEGKSTVALNLATVISNYGKRSVLLVEADVYRPSLCKKLGLDPWPGLTDCHKDKSDPSSAIRRIEPLGFHLAPAGRPLENLESLLPADFVAQFLERMSPDFDWILIDSPPAIVVAESLALKTRSDATLLVVRAGKTQRKAVEEAIQILGREHIVGTVLNGVGGPDRAYSPSYEYTHEAAPSQSPVRLQVIKEHVDAGWQFVRGVVEGVEETGKRYVQEANAKRALKGEQESAPPLPQTALPLERPSPTMTPAKVEPHPETHEQGWLEEREDILTQLRLRGPGQAPPGRFPLQRVGDAFGNKPPQSPFFVLTGLLTLAMLAFFAVWTYLKSQPASTPPVRAQSSAEKPLRQVPRKRLKFGTPAMQSDRKQTEVVSSPATSRPVQAKNEIPISVQGAYNPCSIGSPSKASGGKEETAGSGAQPDRATCHDEIAKQNPQSESNSVINITFSK